MAIKVQKYLVAAGVGVVDEFADKIPVPTIAGWGGQDMVRAVGLVGALVVSQMMPKYADLAENVGIAVTPLFTKSVLSKYVTNSSANFTPRRTVAGGPSARLWAPSQPAGAYRSIT